jgi:serine/threonine protein kinase/tetratricopeptide (TPR) repeat protein
MNADANAAKAIFLEAVEKHAPDQWPAFLDRACAGRPDLRCRVEVLLQAHREAGTGHHPAGEGAAPGPAATAEELPALEQPGTVIGPYRLMEQIGEGGMGTVWMAEQTEPIRRRVAVKVVKEGMDSRQVLARFEAERQALALMDHPHIAKVLDAGRTPSGRPYFVMELVKGRPITDYCDEKRLGVRERLELFADVCRAVQHAHQKGIIHRDLKPSNVLVAPYDGRPVVKVIDFGVAKATGQLLSDRTLFTGFGALVGTPEYMSPEQAEVNNQDIDTRSDIYALGVLLYELLTGSTPLTRQRVKQAALLEVLRVIREEEPPRPSTRLSESKDSLPSISAQRQTEPAKLTKLVRGELDWIAMKALEKDRNRRYETANGFAMDVQRYLADEPVQACPPSARYRLGKLVRRNRGRVAVAAVVLALLLAGAAVSTWLAVRATRAERRTSTALEQVTAAQAQTREALDTLTDDVVETMFAKQPEPDETQTAFLRKVLGFYEAFTQQAAETAEARFVRAKGYFKVAHLRGLLGDHGAAVAGYRQAEGLLEPLAAEFPDSADYRHNLARTEGNLAVGLAKLGRETEAETALTKGIALRTKLADQYPKELRYRLDLANNYNDLGLLRELQHRFPEADAAYRQARGLKEKLVAEAGAEPLYRLELALTLSNTGRLLRKQGKFAESEKVYRRALQAQQEQADKATPRDRQALANSYAGLGIALAELKQGKEAETAFRRARETWQKLVDDFPRVLEYRRELASECGDLGYLMTRLGKDADAEKPYREALDLRKKVVAQAGSVPDYRRQLAEGYHNLAHVLRVTGRPLEAATTWRAALEVWKQLVKDRPEVPDYRNGLAGTLRNLAMLHIQRRDFAAAVVLLEQARPHHQAALKARRDDPGFRQSYRGYLQALAQGHQGLADHARLAAVADELARSGYEPSRDSYDAACLLCRCTTLAVKDAQLADARRKELAQGYADRALALLRQAIALGFNDAAHLKEDPDLDPLRAREEFGKLVTDLEAKTKE